MAIFTNQATLTFNTGSVTSNIVTGEVVGAIEVTKTAVEDTYAQNGVLTYLINIRNTGSAPFTGLTVTDDLGAYSFSGGTVVPLTYVPDSLNYFINGAEQPTPTVSSLSPLTITDISLPAGANVLLAYEVSVNTFAPLGTGASILNTVTVTGLGVTTASATETVTPESGTELSIVKSISPLSVSDGDLLTYTFTIRNYGSSPAVATDNLTLSDTFDPILTGITVALDGTPWTLGTEYNYSETTGIFTTVPSNITVPAATYTQDPVSGEWSVTPGEATLVITGTV